VVLFFKKELVVKKTTIKLMSFLVLFALLIGSYGSVSALSVLLAPQTYYVSPSGSDTNLGTAAAPFKTLVKGVSALVAGDTLVVTGTFNLPLTIAKSGTATAPINVLGNVAVLNLGGAQQNGIVVSGSYVNLSGFTVTGAKSHGVLIVGKHIKFENSSIYKNVLDNGSGTCTGTGGSWGSALKLMIGAEDVILRGNQVYENCGEGIGITRAMNVLAEKNTVRDNYSVNIYIDNSPYVTVQNNTVSCTGIYLRNGRRATGIALGEEAYTGWGAQRHDDKVLNNSVKDCYDGIYAWISEISGGKLINATISGNTVPSGTRRSIAISSVNQNVLIENNTIFTAITVTNPTGVTLKNNVLIGSTSVPATKTVTPANTATPTKTAIPTSTVTPIKTSTPTSVPATKTVTPANTATPTTTAIPTSTATPIETSTPSSVPPTVAPTASSVPLVPTATLLATSAAEIVYDDTDSGLVYSSGWQTTIDPQAYNGSYKVTAVYGASATLDFTGQSFSLLYTDGPSYRRMSVYIDGLLVATIYRVASVTTFQQRWDYPDQLSAGAHTLNLVFANGYGNLDAVIIR
jgi:parallel beta-helix repeat protein